MGTSGDKPYPASPAFARTLLTRKTFENNVPESGAWIRLRDEGTRPTLTLKQVTDATTIDGTTEVETRGQRSGRHAGNPHPPQPLHEARYQENRGEEWLLSEVIFDFDTWLGLLTFVEIEGRDEASIPVLQPRWDSTTRKHDSAALMRSTRARWDGAAFEPLSGDGAVSHERDHGLHFRRKHC